MEEIRKARVTFFINLALALYAINALVEGIKAAEMWRMIFAATGLVGFAVFAALNYSKIKQLKKDQ